MVFTRLMWADDKKGKTQYAMGRVHEIRVLNETE